jgi:hypothetical protein
LSKREGGNRTPFAKLRVNEDKIREEHRRERRFSEENVFSIMDIFVTWSSFVHLEIQA